MVDIIATLKPGMLIPVVVEVTGATGGCVFFKSDDGSIAYRRYQDVRDALSFSGVGPRLVEKAKLYATAAHAAAGQKRKYTAEPYIVHPQAVAKLVEEAGGTAEQVAAAWLHDVVEDTKVTIIDIHRDFGDTVSQYVYWLTEHNEARDLNRAARKDYARRKLEGAPPEVKTIKLADLIDNTQSIVERDPDFARVYMAEKKELIWALKEGHHGLLCRAMQLVQDYEQGRLDEALGKPPGAEYQVQLKSEAVSQPDALNPGWLYKSSLDDQVVS